MSLEEVELELELAGVSRDKIIKLLAFCKNYGFDAIVMDKKLMSMGFEKVFTVYDE
jgi:hypothetical protein